MSGVAVYLETTICSYPAAWPMPQLASAARQQITHDWWQSRRNDFQLYVSELVVQEASAGDSAAERRLQIISGLSILAVTDETFQLQERLLKETGFPDRARADAGHIAIATIHGMDYLMTWNMTHIANAEFEAAIRSVCLDAGYQPPTICTPDELMGREENHG